MPPRHTSVWALALAALASCAPPDAGRPDPLATAYLRLIDAEDARPGPDDPRLQLLLRGAEVELPLLRRTAIRGLGRLERRELVDVIARHLDDPDPGVRGQAADAVAQAVHRSDGTPALPHLLARVTVETDPGVLGVLASSLARLRLEDDHRARVLQVLLDLSRRGEADAPPSQMSGVVLGLERLARDGVPFGPRARARLDRLTRYDLLQGRAGAQGGRIRALAMEALAHLGALRVEHVEPGLRDPSQTVRITAARHLDVVRLEARSELIRRALREPVVGARIAALRHVIAGPPDDLTCVRLFAAATRDAARGVRIVAIDALDRPCPGADPDEQRRILLGAASALGPETRDDWQVSAHALVALARFDPPLARELLPTYLAHENPFVRAWAARAADALGDTATVRALAGDPHPNVRTAALELMAARGPVPSELLVTQLADDDPQLLLTTARLLRGSPLGLAAASACLNAFERISVYRWETLRDPRRELLARVAELGNRSFAPRLEPYLEDYDARVAGDVARILRSWTGAPYTPSPQPLPRLALPTGEELKVLERSTVTLHMRRGGEIVIRPLADLALTNAYRFWRMARDGALDGRTFHRWVPNFVIQGGSPGANEYAGQPRFTRDEVGLLPHWRGTVGLSTRGRDTGDGQIFINLADNVRLNHEYTVLGIVVDGIEVVDEVVEGDVIERAEVRVHE